MWTPEEREAQIARMWARKASDTAARGRAEAGAREFIATLPGRPQTHMTFHPDRVEVVVSSPFSWEGSWTRIFKIE